MSKNKNFDTADGGIASIDDLPVLDTSDVSGADAVGNTDIVKKMKIYVSSGGCDLCDSNDGDVVEGAFMVSHVNCECGTEEIDDEEAISEIKDLEDVIIELQDEVYDLEQEYKDSFDLTVEISEEYEEKKALLAQYIDAWDGEMIDIDPDAE